MYDNGQPSRYRCIEPTGVLDLCPAIQEAKRVDRAVEIAGWFVTGHDYEPYGRKLPDRDLLAELLTVLAVAPAEQAAFLAEVEPTRPELRVAREIQRVLEPPRRFGEIEDKPAPPELRPGQLMTLLGDAPCTRATAAEAQAAVARITAWIAANDARALVDHGDCPADATCRWGRPRKPTIEASCVAAQRGYYSVRWTYVDQYELLAHDALFFVDASTATLMTDAIATGDQAPCGACSGPPPPQLRLKMFRHGTSLVAILLSDPYTSTPRSFAFAVDGKLTTLPPPTDETIYYQFARRNYTERGLEADDLIEIRPEKDDRFEYWRWDAGWKQIAAFPVPQPRTTPPTQEPIGAWLWQQQWHANAREFLDSFNPDLWASTPDYRADTQQALVIVGADPAVGARIAAIEHDAHPAP